MTAAWYRTSAGASEWLEVYGETEPQSIPLERIFATEAHKPRHLTANLYVWTLGYTGKAPHLRVRLLFPAVGSWRVKDLQAVVYHLPPVKHERAWQSALAADLHTAAPVLEAAGQITAAVAPFPGLTMVTAAAAHLTARSAPQIPRYKWYVSRVHHSVDETPYYGVEWILPPRFVKQIGTRVTGALLVQFIQATPAHGASENTEPRLLACARLDHKWLRFTRSSLDLPYATLPLSITPAQLAPCPDAPTTPPTAPAASPPPTTPAAAATTQAPPPPPPPRP